MQISVKIVETKEEIRNAIVDALIPEIDKHILEILGRIKYPIQTIIAKAIKESPEYQSLVDNAGKLRGALGVVNAVDAMDRIIDQWKAQVGIVYDKVRNQRGRIKGGFAIEMIRNDYADVLDLEVSSFISENNYLVPWLEWLLLAGRTRVVQNYQIVYGPSLFSRTGLAIMKPTIGAGFAVPGEFSGTATNNFVTRALDAASPEIFELLQLEMER